MEIRVLGAHNCESVNSSCVSLIIDGSLAIEAGGLSSHLSIQEQVNIGSVIITHAHMDHIKDLPNLALNAWRSGRSFDVYAAAGVCDDIKKYVFNGVIYPDFQNIPAQKPTINFMEVEPLAYQWIDGHAILPVPVKHCENAVGFQITNKKDKTIFFTGDTGPGLTECWKQITPQLLITDVTAPNEKEKFARVTGHLSPRMLEDELQKFNDLKGYFPAVLAIHMECEAELVIKSELAAVAERLQTPIDIAYEGMTLTI